MSARAQALIQDIYWSAIQRVDAANAVRAALAVEPNGRLRVGSGFHQIPSTGAYAIAIGKAALPMLSAAEEALGSLMHGAIAVTKSGGPTPKVYGRVLYGAHPVPDERSFAAGEAVLDFARSVPRGALVVCLISGGGSALVEAARAGVDPGTIQRATEDLLRAGANIYELNTVRARLSRIKAGGLLNVLSGREVVNVYVSDVLGDSPAVIASGPTTPQEAGEGAEDILDRYGVACELPAGEPVRPPASVTHVVVANLSMAIDAATRHARMLGYEPFVLSRALEGEAREVGRIVATIVTDAAAGRNDIPHRCCCIAGGETTVTVQGDGSGGRNTEAALAAAIRLSGTSGVTIGFLATDGDDASTGVAGAIVDGGTIIGSDAIAAARAALARNDSATFLQRRGAGWETGLTAPTSTT